MTERANPDYPLDYDEYLRDCYNVEIGNVSKSYEEWKAEARADGETAQEEAK